MFMKGVETLFFKLFFDSEVFSEGLVEGRVGCSNIIAAPPSGDMDFLAFTLNQQLVIIPFITKTQSVYSA